MTSWEKISHTSSDKCEISSESVPFPPISCGDNAGGLHAEKVGEDARRGTDQCASDNEGDENVPTKGGKNHKLVVDLPEVEGAQLAHGAIQNPGNFRNRGPGPEKPAHPIGEGKNKGNCRGIGNPHEYGDFSTLRLRHFTRSGSGKDGRRVLSFALKCRSSPAAFSTLLIVLFVAGP